MVIPLKLKITRYWFNVIKIPTPSSIVILCVMAPLISGILIFEVVTPIILLLTIVLPGSTLKSKIKSYLLPEVFPLIIASFFSFLKKK